MQAGPDLPPAEQEAARCIWRSALGAAVSRASDLAKLGVHKQWVNRLLEPFAYLDVLVTSTEWENFLLLRDHPDAMPEMQELARKMRTALNESIPTPLVVGDWHIPYGGRMPIGIPPATARRIAVARCARVSYSNHDGLIDLEADLALTKRLQEAKHWSPFEHVAKCMRPDAFFANFRGWRSLRHHLTC